MDPLDNKFLNKRLVKKYGLDARGLLAGLHDGTLTDPDALTAARRIDESTRTAQEAYAPPPPVSTTGKRPWTWLLWLVPVAVIVTVLLTH